MQIQLPYICFLSHLIYWSTYYYYNRIDIYIYPDNTTFLFSLYPPASVLSQSPQRNGEGQKGSFVLLTRSLNLDGYNTQIMDFRSCKRESANISVRVNGGWILELLPLHILYDILSRVHAETVFSCKCVCKTFLKILIDPHFAELHLARAPNVDDGLVIQDRGNISDILVVYNYKLELDKPNLDKENRPCQTLAMPAVASQVYNNGVNLIGSCNGLLCFRYRTLSMDYIFYICNPILGEYLALPPEFKTLDFQLSGLGFCEKTKLYKVVRFFSPFVCKIHTVGTERWRTLHKVPPPYGACFFPNSCFHGNLHWVTNELTISRMICSLNLETEKISFIHPPDLFNQDTIRRMRFVQPGVLGGLFCVSYLLDKAQFEVWVMTDYGLKEFWTRKFSINIVFNCILRERSISLVIAFLNNGDLMLKSLNGSLVCYNLHNGRIVKDMLARKVISIDTLGFVPSFISLKHIASAIKSNVQVVPRKMGRNLWSEGFQFIR